MSILQGILLAIILCPVGAAIEPKYTPLLCACQTTLLVTGAFLV